MRSARGLTRLGVFPIGIDVDLFASRASKASVRPEVSRLRASLHNAKLVIGVDRLEYSKGLANRVRAFAELCETQPSLRRAVSLMQIAVPFCRSCAAARIRPPRQSARHGRDGAGARTSARDAARGAARPVGGNDESVACVVGPAMVRGLCTCPRRRAIACSARSRAPGHGGRRRLRERKAPCPVRAPLHQGWVTSSAHGG